MDPAASIPPGLFILLSVQGAFLRVLGDLGFIILKAILGIKKKAGPLHAAVLLPFYLVEILAILGGNRDLPLAE